MTSVPTVGAAGAPPAPLAGPRLPTVLLAGVTHAGSPALARDLAAHPEVVLPRGRRLDHFTPLRYGRPLDAPLHDYDHHFAGWSGQRHRLETSPVYFDGGRPLVDAVRAALPGVRVLVVLRDPAARLWTGYLDKVASARLPRAMTFDTYVDRCLALRANGTDRYEGNRYFRTLSSGFYVEHLPAWLAFGPGVRLVFAEHLEAGAGPRAAVVADLHRWLGLGPLPQPDPADGRDREPAPAPAGRLLSLLRRRGTAHPPARSVAPVPARPAQRTLDRVRTLYAGPNRELAALLTATGRRHGLRDLPAWLADA